MVDIPIVYAYVYYKLKKRVRTNHINIADVNEIAARILVRHAGFPRFMIKYVIKDLIEMGLLKKSDAKSLEIVESDCDNKVKNLLSVI